MTVQLFKGDCLEILPTIPNKSIDMILCDLPYGTTKNKWDSCIDLTKLWEQYRNLIKENGCIALFGQAPFDKVLAVSNLENFKYEWVWEKNHATGHLNSKKMPLKKHENILIFYKKMPTYNPQFKNGEPYIRKRSGHHSTNYGSQRDTTTISDGKRYPTDILQFSKDKERIHPTQKPVKLLEYLIKTYTNEGNTVLDNCMGSGSTGIACVNTNRNFIGIEKNEKYFNMAKQRIEDAKGDVHENKIL